MSHGQPKQGRDKPAARGMNLAVKLALSFGGLFLCIMLLIELAFVFGVPGLNYQGRFEKDRWQAERSLNLLADLKKERLHSWLLERQRDVRFLGSGGNLADRVAKLREEIAGMGERGRNGPAFWARVRRLDTYGSLARTLHRFRQVYGQFQSLSLVDRTTGKVIVSTKPSELGRLVADQESFLGALRTQSAFISRMHRHAGEQSACMDFSHVVRNRQKKIIAVLVARVYGEEILKPLIGEWYQGLAFSEAVLVNDRNYTLTSLRHPLPGGLEARALEHKILARPALLAARGEEGFVEANDYRGVPVLAAYRHLRLSSELGWGLVIKRDRAEVFEPLKRDMLLTAGVSLLGVALVLAATFFLSRSLARPLGDLAATARKVRHGDLSARAPARGGDEVGRLARDFNSMVEQLETFTRSLEMMVAERTEELDAANQSLLREIEERGRVEEDLRRIEWLLSSKPVEEQEPFVPAYGDLTALNRERTILEAVGKDALSDIVEDFMDLMGTSAAVYEKNGDYALGLYSSGWCRLLDDASFMLCGATDTRQAMACGKWLCHESCWTQCSQRAMQNLEPVDIECHGGLHLYGVPILAGGEVVGAINFGYGDPPRDKASLAALAERYRVPLEELREKAEAYESRPRFLVDAAKDRLVAAARLIGLMVQSKKVQDALRHSEESFRELFNSISDLVYTQDLDGCFLSVNRALAELVGWRPEELVGTKAAAMMKPEYADQFRTEYLQELKRKGTVEGVSVFNTKSGEPRYVEYASHLVKPENGEPYISGSGRDITESFRAKREMKALQEQLNQAQKMEAVGTLAGGIAHDFNNILAGIVGYSELALDDALEGKPTPNELRQILKAAARAKELVRQILSFSRKLAIQPRPLSVNRLIRDTAAILERTIPKMISLELDLSENLWQVNGDLHQLEQVLLNLASNAQDAMPDGGKLFIKTDNVTVDREYVNGHLGAAAGDYVLITVSDTGHGMDRETLEHVFEPFYTTKEVGRGTGLGLSSAYGVVSSHGGHLNCYSKPGVGTTFKIYLPALLTGDRTRAGSLAPEVSAQGRGETILLVDDEESLLHLGERALSSVGYRVLTANNGRDALETYRQLEGEVDLVILDMNMPGMGGHQVLEEVLAINPGAKVVIATGYAAEGMVERSLKSGAAGYIAKPFLRRELLNSVRDILDRD